MANPQVENGYIMIATELFEALCNVKLSGNEFRLLLLIIRNTYGYHCKSAPMSLAELSEATGIDKSHISRTLKNLKRLHIIEILPSQGMHKQIISLQKNYELWGNLNVTPVAKDGNTLVAKDGNHTVANNGNEGVANNGNDYIYNIYIKDNNKNNNKDNKKSNKENTKKIYGEYKHVRLTEKQYNKLVDDYGESIVKEYIKRLDEYIQMKGAKYKDHNLTIRHWLNNANVLKLSDKPQTKKYYGEDDTF